MTPVLDGLRLSGLAAVLALICMPGGMVHAGDGVPALLQFAEQYHSQQQASQPSGESSATGHNETLPQVVAGQGATLAADSLTLRRVLKQRDAQLSHQQVALREQEKRLTALAQALKAAEAKLQTQMAASEQTLKPTDFSSLQQLVGRLRNAVLGSPDAKRAAELIKQARERTERSRNELVNSQSQVQALRVQLADLKKQQQVSGQDISREQQSRKALQQQLVTAQGVLNEKTKTLTMLQQQASEAEALAAKQAQTLMQQEEDISQLRERAKWLVKPDNLEQPAGSQAYAAGSALGRDIIEMLDERQAWGVKADRQTVLAGVIDAFSGQYQLTTDVLVKALAESEAVVNTARANTSAAQQKKGESFVADFKKQKGVKQSPSGFWYRVDYAGDVPIAADAVVDVVVKESLTDGTVIQDMDLAGKVLSQPLEAYPLLFREAIGHLSNHGSLTMVVPPALAYGETGYPPKVPPNATMVYELRVEGTQAAGQ
jgi:FKBP-type peptidyl-prolyl cis-trans isomerase